MRPWRRAAGLGVLALLPAARARAQTLTLRDTAVVTAPRLAESSGLAVSRSQPGIYWVHNDSGDEPFLYATDSTGADLGRVRVEGAGAVDWEDIALGPCVIVPGECLYVGDTGDNFARRTSVTIYRLREPVAPRSASDTLRTVPLLDSIVVRYPDGPHDVETVAVTPGGMLYLVTKNRGGGDARGYRIDLSQQPVHVVRGGVLPIAINPIRGRMVTGGAVSPDGRILALRTYVSVHLFRLLPGGGLDPLTSRSGIGIPVVESQGEGIDFEGATRLVLVSERGESSHAILSRLDLAIPEPTRP